MNKFFLTTLAFLSVNASALAAQPYYVAPMSCEGAIAGRYKENGIHPDYYKTTVRVVSFRTTRNDGTLADSNFIDVSASGKFYGGALTVEGRDVIGRNFDAYGRTLHLVVVSSKQQNGRRIDQLEGLLGEGSSWGYNLKCTAVIVVSPSKTRDDRR